MAYWLASRRSGQDSDWIQRFDPRFWTVNFPRPMMAAVVTTAPDALRVSLNFLRNGDLAGLIWDSEDRLDHPLLSYDRDGDYSRTTLSFRWRSHNVVALDTVNGPTLTIEGRDGAGAARTWYVRLWNYAQGTPEDARVTLPFSALVSGWTIAGGEPVWPRDIDRMFISIVPPGYAAGGTLPLAAAIDGWVELTEVNCEGERAILAIGDVGLPPHGMAMATAFDDCGTMTPARIVRNVRQLGYRGSVLHYCGMSHFPQLAAVGDSFLAGVGGEALCQPAKDWHLAFFAECGRTGLSPIASVSFELLAQNCPDAWQQRDFAGEPARTGWVPPSALLSPGNGAAMNWLQRAAAGFGQLMAAASVPVRLQVGEPWWWVTPDRKICLYDDGAKAALGGDPVEITDLGLPLSDAQAALLDDAGEILANATSTIVGAVRAAVAPQPVESLLLTFLPTVLDPATPEARRANLPSAWAHPAFDRLQVEDYDWLTAGASARRQAARGIIAARLGYPAAEQDYLAGFVPEGASVALWAEIDAGLDEMREEGRHELFVWALPQVCRDGFVRIAIEQEEDAMRAFDDVTFPLALGQGASVTATFSTTVSSTASGFERRSSLWADARLEFDVGPGVRSEAELGVLIGFFRARRGAARGFRLRDPMDFSSNVMTGTPGISDQLLGQGDGVVSRFPLVKLYGSPDDGAAQVRRITRPVAQSVRVSVAGVERTSGWTLDSGGIISFIDAPPVGAEVRAGFLFDVPVRFVSDKLEVSGHAFAAGEVPSVAVIEIREAA